MTYGAGLKITDYLRVKISNIEITRFDGVGLTLSDAYGATINGLYSVDNGSDGVHFTGALANSTLMQNSSIATNCRVDASSDCSNVTVDAAFIGLGFLSDDIESCGAHPWSGSVTVCNNLTVGGSGGQMLSIAGPRCYMETPHGDNSLNVYIGATVTSGYIGACAFIAGGVQFNYTTAAHSYFQLAKNSFNANGCSFGNCGAAVWIVGDTGVRSHIGGMEQQELINGSANIPGSSYVGEWNPYFSTAAPSFTPAAGDISFNKTPAVGGVSEWRAVGTAWKVGGYVDTLAPGTGSLITAAATIAPDHYSHHITGATPVTTITVPTGWTLAPFGPGPNLISLLCNTAVNFGSGGNVGATPFTCMAGQTVVLTLDAGIQVWYPSGITYFENRPITAAVASSGTIAATGPIFHVTGTAAIATMTLPTGFTQGCLTLIPDGIFTTTAAGNIALASTAVVSKAMTMCYDPTTVKWYPSY